MIPAHIFAETLLGFLAPIRQYLQDPTVSEVMVNGPNQIFIERRGRLELTDAKFADVEHILCALRNAAQYVGKQLDAANPILESRLPDGSRLQAVIPPAAPGGPYLSIRRFSRDKLGLAQLVELDTLTAEAFQTLDALVFSKLNILIAGGTGSGKTSLLNALATLIPATERVVVIEDSQEVQVRHPHVVYLEARPADREGEGQIGIRELFRASLRMRPDRIVIGEIRGGEALDIMQAMVSGHGGCLGTLHATYPRDTLTRLETMALMSDVELPLPALRMQIASGVNVILQISRLRDGSRKVTHITEVAAFDAASQRYELRDLFLREYGGMDEGGHVVSRLVATGILPSFLPQLHEHGRDLPASVYQAAQRRGAVS